MESEKSVIKRSFFREYFFYKLRGTIGICIASSVMGFIACVLSGFCVYKMAKDIEANGSGMTALPINLLWNFTMFAGLVGIAAIAIVAPIISFKYYRSRSSMDTLGCLPITYGQRFWGDFLSGLAAIVVPFSVMASIGGIILTLTQPIINRVDYLRKMAANMDCADKSILLFGVKIYFVMLIIIVAAYSITTLVTTCCGKAGSSALYSVIALLVIPATIGLYGTFMLGNAKGILPDQQIKTILSCFPPVGTLIYMMSGMGDTNYYSDSDDSYLIFPNAAMVIISLLFIVVMIVAAYLIGKRRKTERVGNGFVVNTMYHILTLLLVLAVIGIYFSANMILGLDTTKILIGVIISLVFYLILELIQHRNFKKIWKSLIRYTCVAVVGFGFLIAAIKTYGFGIGNHLPNQSDIVEIAIESRNSYEGRGMIKYRAEDAISTILDKNKLLIDNPDKISTGAFHILNDNKINFTYKLKNGDIVSRCYLIYDESLLDDVVDEIKKQPTYEIEMLGVLNRDDFTGMKMTFSTYDEWGTPQNPVHINDSKITELVERLRYDIINGDRRNDYDVGILTAVLPEDWENKDEYNNYNTTHWFIDESYTRTVEFLNNPDNFINKKPNDSANEVKEYYVTYEFMFSDENSFSPTVTRATVEFRSDSDSEYAKELMYYFESGADYNSESTKIIAKIYDAQTGRYDESVYVPEDKHQAALKAILNLIAEQNEEFSEGKEQDYD